MIRADAWYVVNPVTGAALWHSGLRWCHIDRDIDEPFIMSRAMAETLLGDPPARRRGDPVELVPAPQCGCCGALTAYRHSTRRPPLIQPIAGTYRCERHLGRAPCCIDGCGRTAPIGADGYRPLFICGACWRRAPRMMRDAVARVRRFGRRHGWSSALSARHERLWNRTVRAVRDGERIDPREINALFGWSL